MPASTSSYVPKLPPSKGKGKDDKSFLDAVADAMATVGRSAYMSAGPNSSPVTAPSRSAAKTPAADEVVSKPRRAAPNAAGSAAEESTNAPRRSAPNAAATRRSAPDAAATQNVTISRVGRVDDYDLTGDGVAAGELVRGAGTLSPDKADKIIEYVKEGARTGGAPRASIVEDDEVVQRFFAKTHGGSFDPNSRSDRFKMDKILGMVNADPKLLSMSPGKFAMKVYTSK